MLTITNISITEQALDMLREQKARFKPRNPGDVFGLAYVASVVDADGTIPLDFRPGYMRHSISLSDLISADWAAFVPMTGGLDFYFMPRFAWSTDDHYVVDVASKRHELLSIAPEGRLPPR